MSDQDKCFKLIERLSEKQKNLEAENRNLKAEIKQMATEIKNNARRIQSNYEIAHQNSLNIIPIMNRLRKLEGK